VPGHLSPLAVPAASPASCDWTGDSQSLSGAPGGELTVPPHIARRRERTHCHLYMYYAVL
jgi:hypothetical protein